jgi:hypothetical protein
MRQLERVSLFVLRHVAARLSLLGVLALDCWWRPGAGRFYMRTGVDPHYGDGYLFELEEGSGIGKMSAIVKTGLHK